MLWQWHIIIDYQGQIWCCQTACKLPPSGHESRVTGGSIEWPGLHLDGVIEVMERFGMTRLLLMQFFVLTELINPLALISLINPEPIYTKPETPKHPCKLSLDCKPDKREEGSSCIYGYIVHQGEYDITRILFDWDTMASMMPQMLPFYLPFPHH